MLITKIYRPDEIKEAAKELRLGELIAFPTETVYGLGADATNEQAVKRVYLAKGRPSDNPLIVTVSSKEMVEKYTGALSKEAQKLMATFWPGSLTIVLPIKPGALSKAVTGGLETAAFRMPKNKTTLALIKEANVPLVGPSANSSGKPSPTTAQHVFHDLEGRIRGIVDDGPTTVGVESTIIDLSTKHPTILRPGLVTAEELESVLQTEVISDKHKVGQKETPKAPGMKYKHYAPSAQVVIVSPLEWEKALAFANANKQAVAIMALEKDLANVSTEIPTFSLGENITSASQRLFAGLRHFDDQLRPEIILCAGFAEEGLGAAYMNRLKKAAGETFFSDLKI